MNTSKLENTVREILKNKKDQCPSHGIDHLLRTRDNALMIAKNYPKIDSTALEVAALLHDIDQSPERKDAHAESSALMAEKIMQGLGYDEKFIEKVSQIIREHSTENIVKKSSMEAKILFDADKLDGLGQIGIARVFLLYGQRGMTIQEAVTWYRKNIAISLKNAQTNEGKALFEKKIKYVENFLDEVGRSIH